MDITELRAAMPACLAVGMALSALGLACGRRLRGSALLGLAGAYAALVAYRCFLDREPGAYGGVDLVLGATISDAGGYHYYIDNILLFVPFGILATLAKGPWTAAGGGLLCSACIEVLQAATGLGVWQMDDLVANGIGALAGSLATAAARRAAGRIRKHAQKRE